MSIYVTDQAARIVAVKELQRLAEKAAAGVIERGAISELLSGKSEEPRLIFQPWYTNVHGDPEQKALHSDLEEILKKLASLTLQDSKRPTPDEIEKIGRRLEVLAKRIGESLIVVGEAVHSSDFRSVRWHGQEYSFSAQQAACVRIFWEHWKQGTPDVGGETILEACDSTATRVADLFKHHKAWKTMIVPGKSKGTYRLQKPKIV